MNIYSNTFGFIALSEFGWYSFENVWRLTRTLEDIIKMDLKETGCEDVKWIHMIQDRACVVLLW